MSADAKWLRQVASNWWCEGGDGSMFEEVAARIELLEKAMDDMRLTDAEVAAIRLGELACPGLRITDRGKWVDVWAALRGLLERTADTHATPAQGGAQGQFGRASYNEDNNE